MDQVANPTPDMSNHYLSQVFQSLPAATMVVMADVPKFTIVAINEAYLNVVRLTANDLIGKGFYEAYPDNPYNRVSPWNNLLEQVVAEGLPNQSPVSKFILPPDASGRRDVKYLLAANAPIRDERGEITHIVRTITDVTEATLARQTHSPFTTEQFLAETLRIARVGSWEADLINEVITWSDVVKQIYEVPEDFEPSFQTSANFIIEGEHRDRFMALVQQAILTGELFDIEVMIHTWYGDEKWIRITGKPDLVEGVCTRVYGAVQDIHARKTVAQELVRSHRQFESLIQTVDGIVWEADAETFEFSFISDQVSNILGYTPGQWLSDKAFWQNHIFSGDREQAVRYCHRETREMRNHTFDYRMIKADGSLVWIKDIVSVIREAGKPVTLRGIMVDITETKRLENLEHLEKAVLELNSGRDTPLTVILDRYVRGVEELFPHSKCSLMGIKDNRLYDLASPSLPPEYIRAIEGEEIGEDVGSCGTSAFLREQVIVGDIATDPKWDRYRHLALPHQLLACWSYPIILDDVVVATFGVYYDRINVPAEGELKVIGRAASILTVILENRRNFERMQKVQAELAASEARLRQEQQELKLLVSVITNTNDAVLIAESDPQDIIGLKILYANAAFSRITGYPPEQVVGRSPALLKGFSPARNDFDKLQDAIDRVQPLKGTTMRYQRRDEEFFINLSLVPVADARGIHTHWIAIGHDVTDRLRYISEIEERNHKLQEIAWMQSHVIRAPLARLMGLIDLIRNYQHSEMEKDELLDHVLVSAHALDEIIRDISSKTERI